VKRLELERLLAGFEAAPTDADKKAALQGALPTGRDARAQRCTSPAQT